MPFVPKILIIDDDPRMCDSLKVLLGSEGYEIQTRHNGQEALKALVKNDFDFVLLDLVLPDINGAEIMDHINSQTPETFVIVITGHASLDSAIESFRKGAFEYLRKPFEYEELLKRVKNALDQKQLKREKRRVKETLRESEEKFRLAFENAKDAIVWANPETGLIANCNRAAESLLEKTRDEIIGQHQTTLHPSRKAQQYSDMFRRHIEMKGSVDEEAEVITKSGKTIPVHITASVTSVGGIPIIQGIFRDVTERKRAEEALRESEEKLSGILDSVTDHMSMMDEQHNIVWANDVAKELFGPDLVGRKCYSAYHRYDKPCEPCVVKKCFEDGNVHEHETEVIGADGNRMIFWCTASVAARYRDGRPKTVVEMSRNITERKRAEEALRESEKKYSTLVENSLTGIYIDHGGKIVFANNKFAEIYKYARDELIGIESWKLVDPEDRALTNEVRARRLNGEDAPLEYEARGLTKDGETIWLTRRNTRIEYKGKPAILGNLVAITKRKQAEEALHTYHEKLRSLASKLSLAEERQRRRVAIEVHDRISQNLAFVKIKLGTLRASTASSSFAGAMEEMLKLVNETIQNTRALVSELGSPILYELGFVPALEWLTQQTQKQHGIVLAFEDDGQPKPLNENLDVLLFQAVRELLVNIAKHAQARTAKVSITRSGDQVRVDVGDDGVGFDSAETGSSMDTTGRFGLFSIRVRLEPLGGHMEVESKPGHGTRVTLIAPLKHKGENKKKKVS